MLSDRREEPGSKRVATANGGEVIRNLWEEGLHGMTFYHGTSVDVARLIGKDGLRTRNKPYLSEDQSFVEDQAFLWGIRDGAERYTQGKGRVFYLTTNQTTATWHANMGPEIMRIYLFPTLTETIRLMEGSQQLQQYRDDYDRALAIRQRWLEQMWRHEPALVRIKRDSPSFRRLVETSLSPDLVGCLDDFDKFMEQVDQYRRQYPDMSDSGAAKEVVLMIRGRLNNKAISDDIPLDDIEIMTGDEYDSLNPENQEFGSIRKICRGSIGKAPPDLVVFLHRVLKYGEGKSSELINWCRDYGISDQEREQLLQAMVSSGLMPRGY